MKVYQHVNIVTCDQDFHVYLNGILAVKDSQIVYVGQEKSEILEQAEQIIDYQGAWIMPGLVNCHTHSAMTGLRGIRDDSNLHEWLKIDIRNACRLLLDGQQQVDIILIELRAADFPHALADWRLAVQLTVVIAELALHVAFVRLANRAQARSHQAGRTAARKFALVAYKIRASRQALQAVDLRHPLGTARVDRRFNLRERSQRNFLLMRHQFFILRKLRKEFEPHQRIFF